MSFDVSALTAYVEERDFPLIGAVQFDPEMTAAMATVQAGIKQDSRLHFLSTNVVFQDGANCTRSASGTTTLTEKTISTANIAIYEDLCLEDLVGKWAQITLKQGALAGKQVMPEEIAQVYWDEKAKLLAQALDTADWQGDTTSGTNNLSYYDGWIKLVDAGSPVNGNTGSLTSVTTSNIITAVQNMFLAIPQNIRYREDLVLFLPQEWYDYYVVALINANLFHYIGEDGVVKLHGTRVTIKPTYGLNSTNRMFLTYPSNLVVGVDGENDNDFDVRLDPVTNKKLLVDADFRRGTQIFFIGDVVEFRLVTAS